MYHVKLFIITIIEYTCLMILWSSLDKEFFQKEDRYYYKRILIGLLTSLLVILIANLHLKLDSIINFLFFILSMVIVFKRNFINCLVEFCIVTILVFLLQFISMSIFNFTTSTFNLNSNFTGILLINIIIILICLYLYRTALLKSLMDVFKKNIPTFYFIIVNILLYIFTAKWFLENQNEIFLSNLPFIIVVPLIFIGLNFIYTYYRVKLKEQSKALETYNKYVPIIAELLDETRRRQHDFKNHLNTLSSMIQCSDDVNSNTLIREYISSLNNSFVHLERLIHIENKVLAAIIYNKIIAADNLGINFNYKVHHPFEDLPLKEYELSEILNNLLDNAFEAVKFYADNSKHVYLNCYNENNTFIMEVGNTGAPLQASLIKKIFNKGFTTKKEKGHGYGLYNVKKIVDAYRGTIELSYESGYNVFKIYLSQKTVS